MPKKLGLALVVAVCVIAFQDCGQNMGTVSVSDSSNAASITTSTNNASTPTMLYAANLATYTNLNYGVYNLPQGATINWSHTFNDTQKCSEVSSVNAKTYIVTCASAGIIAVNAFITTPGQLPVTLQHTDLVVYQAPPVGPTPVPTPTPIPTPTPPPDPVALAAGGPLYQQYCTECHGGAGQTGVRYTSAATLTYTIQGNEGGMGKLSGLTQTQINDIAVYLNY